MPEDTIDIKTTSKVRRTRRLKVGYNNSQTTYGERTAAIRISGTYLEDIGFKVGDYMDLIINDDLSLTIRPVSAEQNEQDIAARKNVQRTKDSA